MFPSRMNRNLLQGNLIQRALICNQWRSLSSKKGPRFVQKIERLKCELNPNRITVTNDGSTIVAWHPQEPFPYQHSLPLEAENELSKKCSPLNYQAIVKGANLYSKGVNKKLEMEEVQAITYTPKHVWRRRRFDGLEMRPSHPRGGV